MLQRETTHRGGAQHEGATDDRRRVQEDNGCQVQIGREDKPFICVLITFKTSFVSFLITFSKKQKILNGV